MRVQTETDFGRPLRYSAALACGLAAVNACGSADEQLFGSRHTAGGNHGTASDRGPGTGGSGAAGRADDGPVGGQVSSHAGSGGEAGDPLSDQDAGAAGGAGVSSSGPDAPPMGVGAALGFVQSGSRALTRFRGPYCVPIAFSSPFAGAASGLGVQLSALMPGSRAVHDGLTTWVEGITSQGFVACASEDAGFDNAHPDFSLHWLAYSHQGFAPGVLAARALVVATEPAVRRHCQSVVFSTPFPTRPQVQARLSVPAGASPGSRMSAVWLEEVSATGFRLCVEPLANASSSLAGTQVEWLAYPLDLNTSGFSAGEWDFQAFSVTACTTVPTGCRNCENAQLTINHHRRPGGVEPSSAPAIVWGEDLSANGELTFCVHKGSLYVAGNTQDAHLSVSYLLRRENDG